MMQESRTLEMNNVQDGTWHGRGDTICIGGFGEKMRASLYPPPILSIKSINENCKEPKTNLSNPSWKLLLAFISSIWFGVSIEFHGQSSMQFTVYLSEIASLLDGDWRVWKEMLILSCGQLMYIVHNCLWSFKSCFSSFQ